jgi:hypothetical protein
MKFKTKTRAFIAALLLFVTFMWNDTPIAAQGTTKDTPPEAAKKAKVLQAMHSISSHTLLDHVKELCSEKFGGRLTGTEGYNASAIWLAGLLKQWGVQPAGDNDTYLQEFPNPYTLVLESGKVILHIPYKKKSSIEKHYKYQTDFMPGSTSDSGTVKAEVVYVGYGITAPELGYDEYKGLDVKGKIVMMEREVPVSPSKEPERFKKWRPYSFHQYKVKNATDHGAAGMLYIYHIANPNCLFIKDFILTYIGSSIVDDIFSGTGKSHKNVIEKIKKTRKPQSFNTKKLVTIGNVTRHYPDGKGANVIGKIEGSDPELKKEAVMLGAHLDHLGYNHEMMPGANDNASGVAVLLGIAEAIHNSGLKPKRTIIFNFFGAEEQGVRGSEYYLKHPVVPNQQVRGFLNLDGVGRGSKVRALAGENYPRLWWYVNTANQLYVHREIVPGKFHNLARPRLDAARFMWAGIPTISFSTYAAPQLPEPVYHKTLDNPDIITPEIMEDLAQILFIAVMDIAGY